jgi:hypothetical protein
VLWAWFVLYGVLPAVLFVVQIGSLVSAGLGTGDLESLAETLDEFGALNVIAAVLVVGAAATWIVFVRQLTARHTALTGER